MQCNIVFEQASDMQICNIQLKWECIKSNYHLQSGIT